MTTNETAKREQYQEAEQELLKLIEEVEGIEEGDLKGLEEKIYQGIFKIGRKLMEGGMKKGNESEPVPTKMQGECGHPQQLVAYRSKKLLTLFGEVEWKRAYYQCQVEEDQEPAAEQEQAPKCSHGRAPADEKWGVQGKRTTPGVQQYISMCHAHAGRGRRDLSSPAPVEDVGPTSAQLDETGGQGLSRERR